MDNNILYEESNKKSIVKYVINGFALLGTIATIIFCIWAWKAGIFTSTEALDRTLAKLGFWGPTIFVILQIVQVVIPIIPGGVSCAAGVLIFGAWKGFIYNYVGICIGSVLNFLLTKRYGVAFIKNFVSDKTYNKYIGWLDKGTKFDKLFAFAIFLPISPDDFLCMLAGLTKMSLKKFTIIILLCKPASIIVYSLGLSYIIQFVHTFF